MFDIQVDMGALRALQVGWGPAHQKALTRAYKGDGFRLRAVMQDEFKAGIGPSRAPLTRALAKTRRGQNEALASFGRRIAYKVESFGAGDVNLWVGPGQWKRVGAVRGNMRTHIRALPNRMIEETARGGARTVTRAQQRYIAYKIRKRWGEPVKNPRRGGALGERQQAKRARYAAGQRRWRKIPEGWLPKVGASTHWPERMWVRDIVAKQRWVSPRYILRLYDMQMRGERWGRGRWWEGAGFADLAVPTGVSRFGANVWRTSPRPFG